MHRRRTSKDETAAFAAPDADGAGAPDGRARTLSTPSEPAPAPARAPPASAGALRPSFSMPGTGAGPAPPASASPYMRAFPPPAPGSGPGLSPGHAHGRARSISGFAPASPSPLSASFSVPALDTRAPPLAPGAGAFPPSPVLPSSPENARPLSPLVPRGPGLPGGPPLTTRPAQRHSRIHSRNLSIFFPQPGSLPHHAIAEDGAQELSLGDEPVPVQTIPAASASPVHPRRLGEGFTFGGRPGAAPAPAADGGPAPKRRGHHHKHSLSHNFFSFLEPGAAPPAQEELVTTTPTPVPVSPWAPISPFTPAPGAAFAQAQQEEPVSLNGDGPKHVFTRAPPPRTLASAVPKAGAGGAALAAAAQFVLGASVWLAGQGAGSLALTGLGYWVVHDALGVARARVLPARLARARGTMYGPARRETLALFAQAVFLLFAAVYVCKETLEHVLLSFGQEGREGHHHHAGDEAAATAGMAYPAWLLVAALAALLASAAQYSPHAKMADAAENGLAAPAGLPAGIANPYSLAPAGFALALLGVKLLPPHDQRLADLALAFAIAALTFALAYPAAHALGAVLLQTAPARGGAGAHAEAFLRAMRDVERHPQVLHLPAPHVWTLAPQRLVCTLQLHVPPDTDDAGVRALTRWARERVLGAMAAGRREELAVEVTVGVVRG